MNAAEVKEKIQKNLMAVCRVVYYWHEKQNHSPEKRKEINAGIVDALNMVFDQMETRLEKLK